MKTDTDLSSQVQTSQWVRRWLLLAGLIIIVLSLYGIATDSSAFTAARLPATIGAALGGGLVGSLIMGAGNSTNSSTKNTTPNGAEQEQRIQDEALRLRATRERARAIYEMATTLSGTLDHRRVLEAAQNIGTLSLREDLGTDVYLVSAVLLFHGEDNKLRVVTSRGLTPTDQNVRVSGQRGVLGLALQQAQPVFGGEALHDPELRYYAAFQAARSVLSIPLGAGLDLYGVMVFGCDRPNAFSDDHVELMTAIGTQSTLSLQNAVLYQNLLNEKEKIVEVEEDARKKLARDLHDGPTQSVAAIAMRANYIRRLIERQPQQAIEELWKVEDLARRTTKEIRHMLFTLRPLVLENQGLIAALRQLAEKMQDTYNRTVELQASSTVETYLDTNAQGVLFYIIDEAVNNAYKHAQSEHIWVRLYQQDNLAVTEIEDDGVGFDVSGTDESYDQSGSLGMINMRERAGLIEGQLRVSSKKGKGTKVSVLVPIDTSGVDSGSIAPVPQLQLQSQREARLADAKRPAQPITRPHEPGRPKTQPKRPTQPIKPKPLPQHVSQPAQQAPPQTPPAKQQPARITKLTEGPFTTSAIPPRPRTPTQVPWTSPYKTERETPPTAPSDQTTGASPAVPEDKQLTTGPFSTPVPVPGTGPLTPQTKKPGTGPLSTQPQKPGTGPLEPATKKPTTGPLPAQTPKPKTGPLPRTLRKRIETGELKLPADQSKSKSEELPVKQGDKNTSSTTPPKEKSE